MTGSDDRALKDVYETETVTQRPSESETWLKIDLGGTQIFSHAELFTRGFGWWLKSLHGVELSGRQLL